MIAVRFGDVLTPVTDGTPTVVCHQVSCRPSMEAGLALQVRNTFPEVWEQYRKLCGRAQNPAELLGTVQYCDVRGKAGYFLANIFGQEKFCPKWRQTDYTALELAFSRISMDCRGLVIRLPAKMGCGLAGGDWKHVMKILRRELDRRGMTVELWKLGVWD